MTGASVACNYRQTGDFNLFSIVVNQHCGLPQRGMKRAAKAAIVDGVVGVTGGRSHSGAHCPTVNLARTPKHCAMAQRIVAFRREVEEHVKESRFFTSALRSRRKGDST